MHLYGIEHDQPHDMEDVDVVISRHQETWEAYVREDVTFRQANPDLRGMSLDEPAFYGGQPPQNLANAEDAWSRSSINLGNINNLLIDKGRPDLAKALWDRLYDRLAPPTSPSHTFVTFGSPTS